jgi:hypothetical protein
LVFALALLLAAVATEVARAVEAVVLPDAPPPGLLAANAPPVTAKTRAIIAIRVDGVRCLVRRLSISFGLS